jgi:antirestriction protein ArdC
VFFSSLKVKKKSETEEDQEKSVRLLKYFRVFNLDQTEGLDRLKPAREEVLFQKNQDAENLVRMSGAKIIDSISGGAYFNPKGDFIGMPGRDTFASEEAYYSVLFHELIHWTGHEARLKRKQSVVQASADYAFEELVAELGATLLCGQLNYSYETRHAAYVRNWLEVVNDDARAFVRAASHAQNAADYLRKIAVAEKPNSELAEVGG